MSAYAQLKQRRPRVLLVEDDLAARELARIAFEECHAPVELETAESLQAARARLFGCGREMPEMVLLDISLGDGTGHDLLAEIRARGYHDLPVVMLTSSGLSSDRERARALEASDYLIKPAGYDEFVTMIGDLLARAGWSG